MKGVKNCKPTVGAAPLSRRTADARHPERKIGGKALVLETRSVAPQAPVLHRTTPVTLERKRAPSGGITVTPPPVPEDLASTVHAVILAGGPGDNPLASARAVPALPIGGSYRLIDVAIGNCLNSGINKMHVLTQFNSYHVNTHVTTTYSRLSLGSAANNSFVDCIPCTQTVQNRAWCAGSAAALRRALPQLHTVDGNTPLPQELLVLSGKDVYDIDFAAAVASHRAAAADVTIITKSAAAAEARRSGTAAVHPFTKEVLRFVECPSMAELARLGGAEVALHGADFAARPYEASTGMYVFSMAALRELLGEEGGSAGGGPGMAAIGGDVIPEALGRGMRVQAWHTDSAVTCCNSLRNYVGANLELATTAASPRVFQHLPSCGKSVRVLSPARLHNVSIEDSLVSEGCLLLGGTVRRCVLGENAFVDAGADLRDCVINGLSRTRTRAAGAAAVVQQPGIGKGAVLHGVVVDVDARIGDNVRLVNAAGIVEATLSEHGIVVHDGVPVVLAGARVPDNFYL